MLNRLSLFRLSPTVLFFVVALLFGTIWVTNPTIIQPVSQYTSGLWGTFYWDTNEPIVLKQLPAALILEGPSPWPTLIMSVLQRFGLPWGWATTLMSLCLALIHLILTFGLALILTKHRLTALSAGLISVTTAGFLVGCQGGFSELFTANLILSLLFGLWCWVDEVRSTQWWRYPKLLFVLGLVTAFVLTQEGWSSLLFLGLFYGIWRLSSRQAVTQQKIVLSLFKSPAFWIGVATIFLLCLFIGSIWPVAGSVWLSPWQLALPFSSWLQGPSGWFMLIVSGFLFLFPWSLFFWGAGSLLFGEKTYHMRAGESVVQLLRFTRSWLLASLIATIVGSLPALIIVAPLAILISFLGLVIKQDNKPSPWVQQTIFIALGVSILSGIGLSLYLLQNGMISPDWFNHVHSDPLTEPSHTIALVKGADGIPTWKLPLIPFLLSVSLVSVGLLFVILLRRFDTVFLCVGLTSVLTITTFTLGVNPTFDPSLIKPWLPNINSAETQLKILTPAGLSLTPVYTIIPSLDKTTLATLQWLPSERAGTDKEPDRNDVPERQLLITNGQTYLKWPFHQRAEWQILNQQPRWNPVLPNLLTPGLNNKSQAFTTWLLLEKSVAKP